MVQSKTSKYQRQNTCPSVDLGLPDPSSAACKLVVDIEGEVAIIV